MFFVAGNEVRGSMVRVENGFAFLAVDGMCSYWMSGGWIGESLARDLGLRAGKLETQVQKTLEQALPLDNFASLDDCAPVPGLYDVSARTIWSEGSIAHCEASGNRFDAAWKTVASLAPDLWARAAPMDGPIRVSPIETSGEFLSGRTAYSWPLSEPLSSFLIDEGGDGLKQYSPGVSKLITDPASATSLRRLREVYLAERTASPGLFANWDGLKASDGKQTAFVYMRDAMPYEDERGLLPPSAPP
jgi:hypothetical protein